jgi:DNA-binding transcriptional LysR family regulator
VLFRYLECFLAVARERHFARTAEVYFVSQPALSASIAELEREPGVTPMNRGHNFEGLTADGERLVVWARRTLAEKDAFQAEVAAVQSGITGTLRLGVEPTASTTPTLPVAAFCPAHPLAKIKVESRLSSTELHRRLLEFQLEAAIAIALLCALVGAGEWATTVPHTRLHALPVIATTPVARLIDPDTRAQISLAISATTPGSAVARASVTTAKGLALNELFDHPLKSAPPGVDRPRLSHVQRQVLDTTVV